MLSMPIVMSSPPKFGSFGFWVQFLVYPIVAATSGHGENYFDRCPLECPFDAPDEKLL